MAIDLQEMRKLAGIEVQSEASQTIKYDGREYTVPIEDVTITAEIKLFRHGTSKFGWGSKGTARVRGITSKGTAVDEVIKLAPSSNKNQRDAMDSALFKMKEQIPKLFPKEPVG